MVPRSRVRFTRRQLQELVEAERWGEPDGPEIQIQIPIKPDGKIVVTGRDTWGGRVPIPSWTRAMWINSLTPRPGEKYRFVIVWGGVAQWCVVQKSRRRARKGEGATTSKPPE